MGFGPQLVDLDGDGHLDMLSGSWPGEIFLFRGGPDRSFAQPIKLKHKTGKSINIGGGRSDQGNEVVITGDATLEEGPDGTVFIYEGERITVPKGKIAAITGTASSVFAADWDGDGDLDLLVGDIRGNVWIVPNEGTRTAYVFGAEAGLMADGEAIRVNGDAGPHAADWDGDGDLDLLVGAEDGSVMLFRNLGSATAPKLAKGEVLVPAVENGLEPADKPRRGERAKICVTDWNGDGRPDLLLGDYGTQKVTLLDPTPERQAEIERLNKEFKETQDTFNKRMAAAETADDTKLTPEARARNEKETRDLMERMSELYEKLPQDTKAHGWVWFFPRKPAGSASTRP